MSEEFTYIKPRLLAGEPLVLTDADIREGRFGSEIEFRVTRPDGSKAAFTLSASGARVKMLERVWSALAASPEGVKVSLRLLPATESGFESDVWLLDPFQQGRAPSAERLAWERQQARVAAAVGREPETATESGSEINPDDIPF